MIQWVQVDNGSEVQELLEELFETYNNIKILGITEGRKFNVYYKIGKKK